MSAFNCEEIDFGPPIIQSLTFEVNGIPHDPLTNPVRPGSIVKAVASTLNTTDFEYTFYDEDAGIDNFMQKSSQPEFNFLDYDPTSTTPEFYSIPGGNLRCSLVVRNTLGVDTEDREVGLVNGFPPLPPTSFNITYLNTIMDASPPLGTAVEPGQQIQINFKPDFTPGNPDIDPSAIETVINHVTDETFIGNITYTITGNENNCSFSLSTLTYSNADPEIPGTGVVDADFSNLNLYAVFGSASCNEQPGQCCVTGEYDPETGITAGECTQSISSICPGRFEEGVACPDCSDTTIGTPCCPQRPLGRCCSGSASSTPCVDNVSPGECNGPGQVFESGKICSDCIRRGDNLNPEYCGCEGTCCRDNEPCFDGVLQHNCPPNRTFFSGRRCSNCSPAINDPLFVNTCCDVFTPFNGQTILWQFSRTTQLGIGDYNPYPPEFPPNIGYGSGCVDFVQDSNEEYVTDKGRNGYEDREVTFAGESPFDGEPYAGVYAVQEPSPPVESACNAPMTYSIKEFDSYDSCEPIRLFWQTDIQYSGGNDPPGGPDPLVPDAFSLPQSPQSIESFHFRPDWVYPPTPCSLRSKTYDDNSDDQGNLSGANEIDFDFDIEFTDRHPCRINGLCSCFSDHDHPFCENERDRDGEWRGTPITDQQESYILGLNDSFTPFFQSPLDITHDSVSTSKLGSLNLRRACEYRVCWTGGYDKGDFASGESQIRRNGRFGPAGFCQRIGCFNPTGTPGPLWGTPRCETVNFGSCNFCSEDDKNDENDPLCYVYRDWIPPDPFCCGEGGGYWDSTCSELAKKLCHFTDRYEAIEGFDGTDYFTRGRDNGIFSAYMDPRWTYMLSYYYQNADTTQCTEGSTEPCIQVDDRYEDFQSCMEIAGMDELFDKRPEQDGCY